MEKNNEEELEKARKYKMLKVLSVYGKGIYRQSGKDKHYEMDGRIIQAKMDEIIGDLSGREYGKAQEV